MKKWMFLVISLTLAVILAACGKNESNSKVMTDEAAEPFTIGVIPVQTEGAMESAIV
ncbi:MAG: hypothetical protein ACQEXB_04685 [Bacillota bacterium]